MRMPPSLQTLGDDQGPPQTLAAITPTGETVVTSDLTRRNVSASPTPLPESSGSRADTGSLSDGLGAVTDLAAIEVHVDNGVAVVAPVGELDLSNRDTFANALTRVYTERPRRVVIDLARTEFVDACLISVFERLPSTAPCPVSITNPHGIVARLLAAAGLRSPDG